ncbi:MAG: Omp28-related outer membrane protein [Saprospiraceae bacterium]
MKNILYCFGLSILIFMMACKEQPIIIPDPNLNVTSRTVLVEEVTGVRCTNCPIGTQTLIALQQQHGTKKLVVVSLHAAANFSVPYTNQEDYRSPEIQELANYIGPLEGFPTASINRRLLPNETSIFITPHTRWGGEVAQDLLQDPSLAITLENTFDASSRALSIKVGLLPDQQITGEHRLTVLITQDSVIGQQLDGSTLIQNYVHRHMVRDVVTAPSGDIITEALETAQLVNKTFNVSLPATWEAKHCSVVAFVHRSDVSKEILQAVEKHVIN